MKVVYFGSDVFLSCFLYLVQHHEVLALYTYHAQEDYFSDYAIAEQARRRGIPVHYEAITAPQIRHYFETGCELFVSAEYNRILPLPEDCGAFRGVNLHCSMLPQGRGYYPIESAMDCGLAQTGVTLHKLEPLVDRGAILDQRPISLAGRDSVDVYLAAARLGREMLEQLVENLDFYWERARVQPPASGCFWKRPAAPRLTLCHTMTRAQAQDCFARYNQLTQVQAGGKWYYVRSLQPGAEPLETDEFFIRSDSLLYRVADGHLRLILLEKGEKGHEG